MNVPSSDVSVGNPTRTDTCHEVDLAPCGEGRGQRERDPEGVSKRERLLLPGPVDPFIG